MSADRRLEISGTADGEPEPLTAASDDDVVRALEALIIENAELQQLEELISPFNIFEAIGAVRREVRHSDFLAFLLDPRSLQLGGTADESSRKVCPVLPYGRP